MTLDEITYLLDSFNEGVKVNIPSYLYSIEVLPERNLVEVYFVTKHRRKIIKSYYLDKYTMEDFLWTTSLVTQTKNKNRWLTNWKMSVRRESKLKELGI